MNKKIVFPFLLLLQFLMGYAHVGSPDVIMQGAAGPYQLLVSVKPPDVIPGVATVKVYVQDGSVQAISLRAVYYRSGDEGAPEADKMQAVSGQPGQYTGNTWLMSNGSSSVQLMVSGSKGIAQMVVPVVAISTAKKNLPAATGYVLAGLGIFLFILMVSVIGSSVSDALVKPGEAVPVKRKKLRIAGMVTAALLTGLAVYGGNAWWQSWASNYTRYMYHPTSATATIKTVNGANELKLMLDTGEMAQRKQLYSFAVPDHGKMMHLFIMRFPEMDAFAHLHPQRVDSATYRTILPRLPKGKYLVFADVVYVSGFAETIKREIEIKADLTDSLHQLDKDDAYAFALRSDVIDNPQLTDPADNIICGKPGTGVKLKDGSTMVWEGADTKPLEAGKVYDMQFAVLGPDKQPAVLEHYLGMMGHAAIIRNDGNVYMHLHPMGTASMAAENNLIQRIAAPQGEFKYPDAKLFRDSINGYMKYLSSLNEAVKDSVLMKGMNMDATAHATHKNMVQFPYAFPSPGQYRIWVQVKRNGQVLTAAFDKVVE